MAVPEKAFIENKEKGGTRIPCLFNPNQVTINKTNNWKPKGKASGNVPQLDFAGGGSRVMTMELFFDTYEAPNNNAGDPANGQGDVSVFVNQLWDLTMIDESKKNNPTREARPPIVVFHWGTTWSFKAVITSLSVRYTLFRADGTPVRAMANVTFQEASDDATPPAQNPTSLALPGYKRREIRPGDTLVFIAYEEYGNATEWRRIADANELDDPLSLRPGQVLSIPPRN